jgi:predicted dehydrogenase
MRFAVLGLGSIGSRHARNLLAQGHEVIAFDPRKVTAEEDWPRGASLDETIARADAVLVATPTSLHAEHALAAIEAGVPVLVEKPLAMTATEAVRVASCARERETICGVAMNLRFHPALRVLRGLLADGALGRVLYARVSAGSDLRDWRPGSDYRQSYSARRDLGGGVVRDSIHELDYLTWLLGPAESVSAEVGHVSDLEIDVEDLGLALVRLASGAFASVDLTYLDPVYRRGCLIVGSLASVEWDWTRGTIEVRRVQEKPETIDVSADVALTYVAELEDFVHAVRGGPPPCTSVEEGAATVALAEAVLLAAAEGRRIVL